MALLPADAVSQLAVLQARMVSVGDVYFIPGSLARYWQSSKGRPAVVTRVHRTSSGLASVAYLVYGSSQGVPARRALPVPAGEAGLRRDTHFDLGPWLELPTAELVEQCEKIGTLSTERTEQLEACLASSTLPFRSLPR